MVSHSIGGQHGHARTLLPERDDFDNTHGALPVGQQARQAQQYHLWHAAQLGRPPTDRGSQVG